MTGQISAWQGMGFQEEADITAAADAAPAVANPPWFGPADAAAVQGLPGIVIPAPHAGPGAAAAGNHPVAAGQPLVVPPLPVGMHQHGILPVSAWFAILSPDGSVDAVACASEAA